jgi:phosphopentomutase
MAEHDARGRVAILVLDGLGIGALPDAEDDERDSHTLAHVHAVAPLDIPELAAMGLAELGGLTDIAPNGAPTAAFARAGLGYSGADSFLGHAALMGSAPTPELQLMSQVASVVADHLILHGFSVTPLVAGKPPLLVDGHIVIADNIEAKPGMSINVTASLDDVDLEHLTTVGQRVREVVQVPRVIVVAGRGFRLDTLVQCLTERSGVQLGIDSPAIGVYDESFRVRHLSLSADHERQLPEHVASRGGEVHLIGKAADVISHPAAHATRSEDTSSIIDALVAALSNARDGSLIVANVQETDLAGHEQDAHRFARVLAQVDRAIPRLRAQLRPADVLIVTADHGNDPCSGRSLHTREAVPVLLAGDRIRPGRIADITSLADIAATTADFLGIDGLITDGASFVKDVV